MQLKIILSNTKTPRVLLIEDNNITLMYAKELALKYNIYLKTCNSLEMSFLASIGVAKMPQFDPDKYDHIIIDGNTFGRIDGIQYIEALPQRIRNKCIPFSAEEEYNNEMIELGADPTIFGKKIAEILKYIRRVADGDFE
jgi:hypothetical protein